MNLREFSAFHRPSLELNEAKHGLILNALALAESEKPVELSFWTLGNPGECAIRVGSHSIVLGALGQNQCRTLAELADETDYPGVIGPDLTARWFVDRAQELGRSFAEAEPEQIYSISDPPRYPSAQMHSDDSLSPKSSCPALCRASTKTGKACAASRGWPGQARPKRLSESSICV
jgi:hypothetical protein